MTPNTWIRVTGCLCILILETVALLKGVNGAGLAAATAAIGAIVGTTAAGIAKLAKPKSDSE